MLGWEIVICRQSTSERLDDVLIASWTTGLRGLDWLDALVEQGMAVPLPPKEFGCRRYTAPIGSVFEALSLWKPDRTQWDVVGDDYVIPMGWMGEVKFFPERFKLCPAEEMVFISAVDLS